MNIGFQEQSSSSRASLRAGTKVNLEFLTKLLYELACTLELLNGRICEKFFFNNP